MDLHYSAIESARFGLRIFRGSDSRLDTEALLRTIEAEQVDVAILRLPTSEQHRLWELHALPFEVLVADTLVRFDVDMRVSPPPPMRNSRLEVRRGTMADQPILSELIELSFATYRTHYHSNPLFDPKLVLEGYKEWAISSLQASEERICFLFYLDGQAVGYATIALHANHVEGILFGARPNASSPGLYADLVRYATSYAKTQGRNWVRGITQIHNHGVQRVWVREGYLPTKSYSTIHINALLSQGFASADLRRTRQPATTAFPDSV